MSFLEFFNRYWVLLALVLVFVFIGIKLYSIGVHYGAVGVCADNNGIFYDGECVSFEVNPRGYRICDDNLFNDEFYGQEIKFDEVVLDVDV